MSVRDVDRFPGSDDEVAAFAADLGLDGIVDIHVHAMPERLQQAVWRYFDGLTDPPWPVTYRQDVEARLDHLRRMGVVAHTALAYAHRPGMLAWLNGFTLDLADAHPQVLPTFTIFAEDGVSQATADAIDRGGAVVKVHTQVGRFHVTDPRLDESWRMIAAARLPVVLHATAVYGVDGGGEFCGVDAVRSLLDRHPGLTLVIAHVGMPEHHAAMDLAAEADDVHLDVAMTLHDTWADEPAVAHQRMPRAAVERLGGLHDRVLFGSDHPTIPHDYATQVRALARLGLDDAGLRDVLAGNARRLLARRVPAQEGTGEEAAPASSRSADTGGDSR